MLRCVAFRSVECLVAGDKLHFDEAEVRVAVLTVELEVLRVGAQQIFVADTAIRKEELPICITS